MSSTQSSKHAVVAATALATVTLALWMYRRQRRQQPCGAAEEIPAAECAQHAGQKGAEKQQSSVQLPPLPMPSRPVCIIYDGSADSSRAVANILEEQLGTGFDCASSELANLPTDALRVGGAFLFVVECDKEGEATAARPFTRALRPLRMADSQALDGASVGVLALAHSVCAYSAASGGSDKFRGGARLLSSLTEAGARPLHALGMAEMEVRVCRATTPRRVLRTDLLLRRPHALTPGASACARRWRRSRCRWCRGPWRCERHSSATHKPSRPSRASCARPRRNCERARR